VVEPEPLVAEPDVQVVEPEPEPEPLVEEPPAPASGTEEVPSAATSGPTVEPEVQVVQPEPEVAEPLVVEPEPEPEPEVSEPEPEPEPEVSEPEPEPEPRRLVLDMTMDEPADDEVKESASEADDGSETRRPAEVDRVALTREFAQLFADVEGADES
jgi:hypothetical protein